MFLKVLTTALVLLGLAMLLAMPFVVGERPAEHDRLALAQYGERTLAYFAVACFTWVAAAGCAVALMRRARREYLESQRENLSHLIEGTLKDHERRQ